MQSLGLFEIYREAYKMVLSWMKIFSQITLALIFPMCFIFLGQTEVSEILYENATQQSISTALGQEYIKKLSNLLLSSKFKTYLIFKTAYLTYLLIVSFLSTSTVAYTVACIHTGRKVTFDKAMGAFPKVLNRLLLTSFCTFIAFLAYQVMATMVVLGWDIFMNPSMKPRAVIVVLLTGSLRVLYFVGLVYIGTVWQLAQVVSVLEDLQGFQAMIKSQKLIKGKMWMAIFIFFNFSVTIYIVESAFQKMVVQRWHLGMWDRVVYGTVCLMLLIILSLFERVIKTVFYFVCKSYQHEDMDMSVLSGGDDDEGQLEIYLLGDHQHVFCKGKDVQHYQFYV
ncbi:hypothetical protein FNV43_RR17666 [Rhamnella rubrinervis]|uniref:Uncharacterized protein n=1 Tax=Rhamnella rubrinervis TaxID=2594499 RepID=A0A8K0GV25_9ROSA|nr:hypothetical protein FNV43_RR17666 [Rhamnella rubrinervis]